MIIEPLLHGADVNLPPALLAQIAAIKVLCDYIVDSEAVNDPRQGAHVVLQSLEQGAVVAGITHRALLRVVICGCLCRLRELLSLRSRLLLVRGFV